MHLFCSIAGNGAEDEQALKKISFYIESPYDLEVFLRNKPVLATAECFVWCGFEFLLQGIELGSRPIVLHVCFLLGTQMWGGRERVQRPLDAHPSLTTSMGRGDTARANVIIPKVATELSGSERWGWELR